MALCSFELCRAFLFCFRKQLTKKVDVRILTNVDVRRLISLEGWLMSVQVTEAEWKIMECLWDHAPQTMGEITATLEPTTGWTRQTVITLLKRMTEKGAVSMDDSGRAKKYVPLITREEASTVETHKFLDHVFKGKASLLVNHLVDSGDLSANDLQQILDIMRGEKK